MKKRPILNAYEMKLFKEWIADGNAVENEKGVWLEQTTQYRKKFTYEELQKFFKNEFLMYKGGGSAKNLLSSRASKVAKKEKSLNLKAYNVPSVPYAINPLNEGLDEILQDIVGKDELREAMSGVDFVGNTATGTDAIKLLHLVGKREGKFKDGNYYLFSTMENEWSKDKILSKEMSVAEYYKQRSLIDQRFPNWIAVVYDSFDYKQEFNLPTLYDIVNSLVVSKLLNKEYYGIIIEFKTKDGAYEIGFNAKNLRNLIKSLIMAGITDATGYFNAPSRGVTILDSSLKFPNKNKRDEFFMENSFGLVMPIMIPDEETLEEKRKEGLRMAEWDNLVYEFPVIRVISPNEYEIEIYGQDTLTYSRGKGIKIGTKSTTKSTPKETPKATPKTTDKKTALGNKLRKGMVVRIEYKESNGSLISYDLFYDKGNFIEYLLITDKKGKEIVETEEIITEKELNEKYTDLSEFIIAEFYETKEDGGELMASDGQMELFVGGGRAVRPSMFEVYQVTDKMRRSMYLNDNELQKFLNDWNEDYDTDYEDWSEFNQYENEVNITPIFSKNDDGGYVDKFNYPVAVFKLEEINVDEKNKDKPLITNQEGIDLFIDRWNDRLGKNYKNWREFNKGEKNLRITPVFSSNEMGGNVDFEEVQINDIANWENDEIANYLDLTTEEVAKNRQKYVRLAQNELMLSGVDSYDDGGGVGYTKKEILNFIKELKRVQSDISEYKKELVNDDLSEWEKENIENNKLPELRVKEDYFIGQLRWGLKNYIISNGKPLSVNQETYEFLQTNGFFADGGGVNNYAKGGTVIASSPTLEGIKKLISEYLYGSTITLVQIDDDGEFFEVHNKKGITPFYVKLKNNKYQFVPSQDNYSRGGTLDKKYNFNDFGIKSYRELIDRNEFVSKFKSVNNSSDFDRIKFNRMRGEEQLKYVQRLNKQVNKYNLTLRDGSFYEVSKEIFDYADIPETETKNYYTKFDEPSGYIWKRGGSLKRKSNDLGEYYDKYVNGGFVGGDIIKFKYNGKDFTRKVESVDEMGNAIVNLMKSEKATINPADIFDIKKEFTEKDVIIKKIGLSEENADFLISLSPTFAVWLADSIVELTTKSNLYGSRAETIKALNESPYLVAQFRERIRGILDWLQHPSTPKQNLRELTFAEAEKKSEEWHKELSTSGGDIDYTEPKENIILKKYAPNEFGITYYWVFIPKSKCNIEGKRMGHCGTTGASSLISLRSVRAYTESSTITDSHVTVAYDIHDAKFYQGKAKKNAKPSQKYFPYIFDLIQLLANGDINKEYQKELQEKTTDLQIEQSVLEEKQEKLIKYFQRYFQSEKAKKENVESLIEKANNLIEIKEKIEETNQKINQIALDINFDFNGFGCEYKCENDYGWEDMTNEQIKELYKLKPELFNDLAGQYMLYEIGLIDKQPNTIVTIEKPVEYVADLLSLDRDLSDDFVEKVLTGDTYEWFDGSDSWRYYYENAGDYVDDLNREDYDAVLDKIVEITGLDKEIVEENGAKHYLDGDDEEFDSENFEDIKRAIASALEGTERSSYENYYYEQIENALSELGTIKKLDDTGVEIEVDLKDLIGINAISSYMKDLDSENLEDVFFEAESNGAFSLPDLSIDDRFSGDTNNWQDGFDIDNYAVGGAVYPDLSMQKPQVVNDSIQLAEFELKQAKELTTINNIKNQKILSSDDAVDIFRQIWEKDTINAYEQAYVLFLNKNNKPKGFYHHSSGGIDGTIMDVQMICGMAIKSLSKGVIIAHNHPSQNTQPSDADKRITQQIKEALKLFNIQLLDSLILTENSSLSFADEGIL